MTLLLVREQMVTLAAFEKENKEKNRKLIKTKQTQKWQEETWAIWLICIILWCNLNTAFQFDCHICIHVLLCCWLIESQRRYKFHEQLKVWGMHVRKASGRKTLRISLSQSWTCWQILRKSSKFWPLNIVCTRIPQNKCLWNVTDLSFEIILKFDINNNLVTSSHQGDQMD